MPKFPDAGTFGGFGKREQTYRQDSCFISIDLGVKYAQSHNHINYINHHFADGTMYATHFYHAYNLIQTFIGCIDCRNMFTNTLPIQNE